MDTSAAELKFKFRSRDIDDAGVFTIILTNTLDNVPPETTATTDSSITFDITFVDPCTLPSTTIIDPGDAFTDMVTTVKLGSYIR